MAETIARTGDGGPRWLWHHIMRDLEVQGGIRVVVDPFSVREFQCSGRTEGGTLFGITWMADTLLMLSMTQVEPALTEAFAKVLEYRPFCRYIDKNGLLTIEWDKVDPEKRFIQLEQEGMAQLQRIQ